jgi:hypothetical protein
MTPHATFLLARRIAKLRGEILTKRQKLAKLVKKLNANMRSV